MPGPNPMIGPQVQIPYNILWRKKIYLFLTLLHFPNWQRNNILNCFPPEIVLIMKQNAALASSLYFLPKSITFGAYSCTLNILIKLLNQGWFISTAYLQTKKCSIVHTIKAENALGEINRFLHLFIKGSCFPKHLWQAAMPVPDGMFLNSSLAHVINTRASTCTIHTC